ncbi:hypothetical protein D9M71_540350 [compost metagenome]
MISTSVATSTGPLTAPSARQKSSRKRSSRSPVSPRFPSASSRRKSPGAWARPAPCTTSPGSCAAPAMPSSTWTSSSPSPRVKVVATTCSAIPATRRSPWLAPATAARTTTSPASWSSTLAPMCSTSPSLAAAWKARCCSTWAARTSRPSRRRFSSGNSRRCIAWTRKPSTGR